MGAAIGPQGPVVNDGTNGPQKNPLKKQVLMERWAQRVLKVKQGSIVWQGLME
jgi:hypothetical protein